MECGKIIIGVESFWEWHQCNLKLTRERQADRSSVLGSGFTQTALEFEIIVYKTPLDKSDHVVMMLDHVVEDIVSLREIKENNIVGVILRK